MVKRLHLLRGIGFFLCLFCLLIVCQMGCSKGKEGILPDGSNVGHSWTDSFRDILWTGEPTPDQGVGHTTRREKNADITNVVWGNYWHDQSPARGGLFKTPDNGDEYSATVAAFQISDEQNLDSEIFFRVCYRDDQGVDQMSDGFKVRDPSGDWNEIYPAVTAHINEDSKLVVDIVYMISQIYIFPDPPYTS